MPINKDAMARYRILDRMLSDPNHDYTTNQILERVCQEYPSHKVTLRMIQKDIHALEEEFKKEIERGRGGRGTVRYKDQSSPLFYQELSSDEEELLREALRSLGQFAGLENFKWLELLRKKLEVPADGRDRPAISFFSNDVLQVRDNLLGQLFSAVSHRKAVRFGYRRFADKGQPYAKVTVYPYQLRQFNDRWFLICNPVGNERYPFTPDTLYNYALDRMDGKVEVLEDMPFIDTPLDINARFDEIVGVTYLPDAPMEDIFFAVKPGSVDYVRTKFIHPSQDEVNPETEKEFRKRYPSLKDCRFFFVNCRPNYELFSRFASYGDSLVVLEPAGIRNAMQRMMRDAADNYTKLD